MKTIMRIVSVLMLITGVAALAMGAVNIGFFQQSFGETVAAVLTGIVVVMLMLGGLMDLICGLLGLRAAARPGGSTAAVVFGVLAVLPGAVTLALSFSTQHLLGLVMPGLYLICATVLKAAGKAA